MTRDAHEARNSRANPSPRHAAKGEAAKRPRKSASHWSAVLLVACLLAAWEIGVRHYAVPRYILPAPSAVLAALVAGAPTLLAALGVTLAIALAAMACAVASGVGLAFSMREWPALDWALSPIAVTLQVTPLIALAPLILIYVDDQFVALVLCAWLVAFFPMLANMRAGLENVDPGLEDLFALNGAGRLQRLLWLRLPASTPYFFAGLASASGLALIGAVVAEFVAGSGGRASGLAYRLLEAGYRLDIARLFAALTLLALTGVALHGLVRRLEERALRPWRDDDFLEER